MGSQLSHRARNHDDAFLELYDMESAPLYAFVLSVLGNRSATDRMTSALWLEVLRDRHQFHPRVSFTIFLYRRALRTLDRHLMQRSFRESIGAERLHPDDAQQWVRVMNVLRNVTAGERSLFYLYYFSDFSLPEICRITGLSEREVFRIHNQLRRAFSFSDRELKRLRVRAYALPSALERTRLELLTRMHRLQRKTFLHHKKLQHPYRHPVLVFERVVTGIHSIAITTALVSTIIVVVLS